MSTDLTFITNEGDRNLLERFKVLIGSNTQFFDCLVGYFYTSGFYKLYPSLEATEKIRILIGLKTDRETFELIQQAKAQQKINFSHAETKEQFSNAVANEMEQSEDNTQTEVGVKKFLQWLIDKKVEIRAFPTENIHAKLYIMSFAEGDRDDGRVITGSSNFSQSGLVDNLEFNVELKNPSDYHYALKKFNELWENSVDVSEQYVATINTRTWLNDTLTPYDLYLKFLYEYFNEKIQLDQIDIYKKYLPEDFLDLEYQSDAVKDAKNKLEVYGGVFVSDVVGLGKTYISAMLAQQLDGRSLVLAPPVLLEKGNPGSWVNVFSDFGVPADFESLGKLDNLIERGTDKYKNIFIDEAHRFRSESNITYEKLAQVCRGKRVILVTATPLNNSPKDILSQIKLFQKSKKSTIPNISDLERFFAGLENRLKKLDRKKDYKEYLETTKEIAEEIRDKVLKHIMVRRTRSEIVSYFGKDLERQNLKFPEVENPEPVYYELSDEEDKIFTTTIELIVKDFRYARYTPLISKYFKGEVTQLEEQSQKNMGTFMKILLIKRLESSFYAFRNSLRRFINSYEQFLEEFDKGNVYLSKKYTNKLFELLENDNDDAIQRLIDEDKAQKFEAKDFKKEFKDDLENDLAVLRNIAKLWEGISRDPKLLTFINVFTSKNILRENKLIIFTESKETAEYLESNLQGVFPSQVIAFTGQSNALVREKVIENFDAKARFKKDDYRILIATEVLAEGVNLHRSNVVINYDIPWNPTRLMQRVGRINRVDTKFDKIYSFNFFPTKQSNDQIKLKEAAEAKIQAFIQMLGADARLLTDGEEIESFTLFNRLNSKATVTGEDETEESELKYLQLIRNIRDNNGNLFTKIKRLPKKARTAKKTPHGSNAVLTYFRKGKLQKFYITDQETSQELDFFSAAKILEADPDTQKEQIGEKFFEYLEKNKKEFELSTTEEMQEYQGPKGGRDNTTSILRILRSNEVKLFQGYTEDDESYIKSVIKLLQEGGLPKQTTKTILKKINNEANPLKILAYLRAHIAPEFFLETQAESLAQTAGPREVILSEYLVGE